MLELIKCKNILTFLIIIVILAKVHDCRELWNFEILIDNDQCK